MRNFLKNNIIGGFKNIYEQHDNARKFIEKKTPVNAKKALTECKSAAQSISEETAKSEGESCPAVICLNEYCAAVDEALANIFKETNGNKLRKQLDKLLLKAENSVKNDVKVKLEVVFMPYKASMWDSLESVWKAASDDSDCAAYVVPIPYYDRNPDGSFGEFHYEGGDYPEYVPVTHYDEYDLAARRPDVIYIHNAYDEANVVTSVDPRFYSSELKKYTDMLVYVPYFVLREVSPENEKIVRKIEHFILIPGVVNSDRVIVQSEDMRSIYINVLLEHSDKSSVAKAYFEKKILGTGSPKFDKVSEANSYNEDLIPDDWKKIIYKKDGTRKKVIFYNTSINALLNNSENYLEKLCCVLEFFKNHSEETALLWRPHPLFKSSADVMRPQLSEKYENIRSKYIAEGWGILDESPDFDKACRISDAFYGDRSSVAELFRRAAKPVMLAFYDTAYFDKVNNGEIIYKNYSNSERLKFLEYCAENNRERALRHFVGYIVKRTSAAPEVPEVPCGRIIYDTIKNSAFSENKK